MTFEKSRNYQRDRLTGIGKEIFNVNLRKLLTAHKSHFRETSLFTGMIPNQVRNSQISRFVSVPGQNPERLNRSNGTVECVFKIQKYHFKIN